MPRKSLFPISPTQVHFLASNQLKQIAGKAADSSDSSSDSCLVAILFSAAWFEASLNEAILDLFDRGMRESTGNHMEHIRVMAKAAGIDNKYAKLETKVRVLCAAATKESLVDDVEPWVSVFLLFQLRNWIMHLRPELLSVREGTDQEASSLVSTQVHDFVLALRQVGAIKEIPQGRMVSVTQAIQFPGVGQWAYRSAYEGLRAVDTWLPHRYRPLA